MAPEKKTIRQQLLTERQNLSSSLHRQLSHRICQHLEDFLEHNLSSHQTVLAYWPYRQEPDLSPLLRLSKYRWGLPRCLPDHATDAGIDRQLAWHSWQSGEQLITNRYGLMEPAATLPVVDFAQVGAILIPAVAINQQGYRLGYGGGYFDRLLNQPNWQQVMTIGVVFDFAYVPTLPVDKWDQPLAAICTESGLVSF